MFIPLSVPNIKGNELQYVTEAVETEWVSTGGSAINAFEEKIANYLQVESAVACQSGTAGLHLALKVLDIGQGDEVLCPALTFIATVNPITYVGAEPVFLDCDHSLCLDLDKLEQFCKEECELKEETLYNKKTGNVVKAVMMVHIFGNMPDMTRLLEIVKAYHLLLIEDAAEALGSYEKKSGRFAGTFGDIGVFSFNGNKIITTGGGGMVVAKDKNFLVRVKYLSTQAKDDEIRFIHHEVGFNYRMTNLQAAMGLGQLERLEEFIETKGKNHGLYEDLLKKPWSILHYSPETRPNYWFYSLLLPENFTTDQVVEVLGKEKIQARPIWGLMSEQKPFVKKQSYQLETCVFYQKRIVNLPCSSNLTPEQVERVCTILNGMV